MIDLHHPDPGIEISIATRGISKGLTQTDGAQLVVRPELAFGDLYLGAYAKNVTSTTSDGEGGPAIGLRTRAGGFNLAASATLKLSIDPAEGSDAEALELAGSAARRFGPLNLRLGDHLESGRPRDTGEIDLDRRDHRLRSRQLISSPAPLSAFASVTAAPITRPSMSASAGPSSAT